MAPGQVFSVTRQAPLPLDLGCSWIGDWTFPPLAPCPPSQEPYLLPIPG